MLFGKKTEPETPAAAPATQATDPSRPEGKGRPTPKRKEAEAANRRPLVGETARTPEAKAKARSERARAREAMMSGEERYLPERDKGPERRFLRDSVDARRTFGEFLLPTMLIVLALTFIPQDWARVASMVGAYGLIILTVLNSWMLWRSTKRAFTEAFGKAPAKGMGTYVVMRSLQMRGSRVPRPAVRPGEPVVRR